MKKRKKINIFYFNYFVRFYQQLVLFNFFCIFALSLHSKMTEKEKIFFYEFIGNKVKQLRVSLGMTQEDLAKKLGKSRVTVVNIEKGRQHPPLHMIIDFSRIFNIPAGEFINETKWGRSKKTDLESLINELDSSMKTKKGKTKVLEWLNDL